MKKVDFIQPRGGVNGDSPRKEDSMTIRPGCRQLLDSVGYLKVTLKDHCDRASLVKGINIDEDPKNANWLHEARLKRKEKELKYDEKYYTYLDKLRESAVTNMFGATPYLLNQFHELDKSLARKILADWMKTFGERLYSRAKGR